MNYKKRIRKEMLQIANFLSKQRRTIMIKFKCDLCQKETTGIKTMILNKKSIDYCKECEKRAERIKEEFRKIMKYEYLQYENSLKKKEKEFYEKIIKK